MMKPFYLCPKCGSTILVDVFRKIEKTQYDFSQIKPFVYKEETVKVSRHCTKCGYKVIGKFINSRKDKGLDVVFPINEKGGERRI